MKSAAKKIIGWREWVSLPELNAPAVKVKIDTGAQTSALHVSRIKYFSRDGRDMVSFRIHPFQRSGSVVLSCEAEVLDRRWVKSSSGHRTLRPMIVTAIELMGQLWEIEVTLTNRDNMGFRMLLGRQAFRKRFVVDAGRSYVAGKGPTITRSRQE